MTWWKVLYFAAGILTLIAGVQDSFSWWKLIIGVLLLYLGVIAK